MAIKANASSMGGGENFKKYVGVASFRVLGVNPTKAELEKFYGRDVNNDPVYLSDKTDDEGKPYKSLRVSFMIQADKKYEDGKEIKENEGIEEDSFKTIVSFFIQNRYYYNNDKTKVQVIDKFGRTAWVPIEQAKNHQIPVYKDGPARIDKDYRPAFRGEAELTKFILNYLNVTPIDSWNRNTAQWVTNPHPEDCEGNLSEIANYFKGDIKELKSFCQMMPSNRVKLCVGIRTNDDGTQFPTVYTSFTMRNGTKSYKALRDDIVGRPNNKDIFTDDAEGKILNIHVYKENVEETDLSNPVDDPFAAAAALPDDDLPFGEPNDDDPFA